MGLKFNDKAISRYENSRGKKETSTINLNQMVVKLIRYKRLTDDDNHFLVLYDDTYAEMLQIEGIGLETLAPVQVNNVLNAYLTFLRRYLDDVTYVTSLYPVEIDAQRAYWVRKYDHAKSETQRHYIDDRIAMLDATHKQKSNQEYMLILYGDTEQDLKDHINLIKNWGGGAIKAHSMSVRKKTAKLEQLNNMNSGSRNE